MNDKDVIWSYDREGDVLYINFGAKRVATDVDITDDDIIVRCDGDEIIGITILNARQRLDEKEGWGRDEMGWVKYLYRGRRVKDIGVGSNAE